jgi:hypothetical protein
MDLADFVPGGSVTEGSGPRRRLGQARTERILYTLPRVLPVAVVAGVQIRREPPGWTVYLGALCFCAVLMYVQRLFLRRRALEAAALLGAVNGMAIGVWAPSAKDDWDIWALVGTDLVAPDGSSRSQAEYRFVRASQSNRVRWLDVDGKVRPVRGFR